MWRSTPREGPKKRYEIAEPATLSAGEAARAVVSEDGLITIRGMENVALAFLGMSEIRERQAEIIQEKLVGVAERCKGRLAVSLSGVTALTSSGINALVAVHSRCAKLGGHLAIFAASKEIVKMVRVTKLDRALVIAENAHEAVQSFNHSPKRGLLGVFGLGRGKRDAA